MKSKFGRIMYPYLRPFIALDIWNQIEGYPALIKSKFYHVTLIPIRTTLTSPIEAEISKTVKDWLTVICLKTGITMLMMVNNSIGTSINEETIPFNHPWRRILEMLNSSMTYHNHMISFLFRFTNYIILPNGIDWV